MTSKILVSAETQQEREALAREQHREPEEEVLGGARGASLLSVTGDRRYQP